MTFPFFNHNVKTLIKTDIHSHLIPNIDDGAKNMETSIELIRELISMGYSKLITTPHISDMFPNTKESILENYNGLKDELLHRDINIDIEIAAEYYADEYFDALLEKKEILTFGKEKYLLFELSYFTPHKNLNDLIYEIQLNGFIPVLAHPERYIYLHDNYRKYKEIKEMGVLFQLNLNSLNTYYNVDIQAIAEKLIKDSLIDFIGSDTHHMTHIKSLKRSLKKSFYKKIFKHNKILNDTLL